MATPQEKLIELPYGVTGLTDVYGIVMRRTDEYYLDASDGSFGADPANKYSYGAEHAVLKQLYQIKESRAVWTNGLYLCAWYQKVGASEDPAVDTLLGTTLVLVISDRVTILWQQPS